MSDRSVRISIPNPRGVGPPTVHSISSELVEIILDHPSSRYSRLASDICSSLDLSGSRTISLRTDPSAFQVLLRFLESGPGVYSPASNELQEADGEITLIRRDAVKKVFRDLQVDWPWEGAIAGIGEEMERPRDDYSSPEIYQALKDQVDQDLYNVLTIAKDSENAGQDGINRGDSEASSSRFGRGEHGASSSAAPPSYEFSAYSQSPFRRTPPPDKKSDDPPSTFKQTLQNSLEDRLAGLLLTHIQPAVHQQARNGVFKGTFILLPVTPKSAALRRTPRDEDIVTAFEKRSEYRKILHLQPESYSPQFIVQENVMEGIKLALARELGGVAVFAPEPESPPPPALLPPPPPQKKKGFFARFRMPDVEVPPPPPPPPKKKLKKGTVSVDAAVEDVYVRSESELGLMETEHTRGVVVWVEMVV